MRAGIHAQRPADRARNATVKGKTGNAGLGGRFGQFHIRHRRARANFMIRLDSNIGEKAFGQANHHACHAAVAHQHVGAKAEHIDRNAARQSRQEIAKVVFVGGHKKHLRRAADAKPGDIRQLEIGRQPPA